MNSFDVLSQLNPVTYTWNLLGQQHGGKADTTEYGFLAQDVESILPSAVSTSADGYKSLNYIDFIPHLVGAVKGIMQTDIVFSGSLSSLTTSVTELTASYTTVISNMVTLKNTLDAQSLALTQLQQVTVDLQSQIDSINTNIPTPVINNNYYTTIVQTGSTNTGENSTGTTIINNYYYTTGSIDTGSSNTGSTLDTSIDHSGSIEWTHSGLLLAELTGSGMSGSVYTGTLITPRDAFLYIS